MKDPVSGEESLSSTVLRLRKERDGLRRAMRNRAVIEQAKGILAERLSISPEDAFTQLIDLSTHSNIKLAELAAALVAGHGPGPDEVPSDGAATAEILHRIPPVPVTEPRSYADLAENLAEPSARRRLLTGRVDVAQSYDEIAEAVAASTLGWPAPATVVLMLLEPDGALRLAGSSGLTADARSRWSRVPPIDGLPMIEAVRQRRPMLLADSRTLREDFPTTVAPASTQGLAAIPLIHDGGVLGVMEMFWERPYALDVESRAYVLSLATPIAARCVHLAPDADPSDEGVGGTAILPLVLDSLGEAVVLLAPVYDDAKRIVDFRPESASPAARALADAEELDDTDGSLLTFLPRLGSQRLLALLAGVVETGEARSARGLYADAELEGTRVSYRFDVHATRLWDRVLVTCHLHTEADLMYEQLLFSEEVAGTGSFRWDLGTGQTVWSPGMYRLLGRRATDGPLPTGELGALVHPGDFTGLLGDLDSLGRGLTLSAELRGAGPVEGRRFKVTAVPHLEDGALSSVSGTCQDITDARSLSARLKQSQIAVATGRRELDSRGNALNSLTATPPPDASRRTRLPGERADQWTRVARPGLLVRHRRAPRLAGTADHRRGGRR